MTGHVAACQCFLNKAAVVFSMAFLSCFTPQEVMRLLMLLAPAVALVLDDSSQAQPSLFAEQAPHP